MYGWGPVDKPPYLTGGYSEYCYVMPICKTVRVPDELDSRVAASATCAFRTVVHAFEELGALKPTDTVVIQGTGPVGLYAFTAEPSDTITITLSSLGSTSLYLYTPDGVAPKASQPTIGKLNYTGRCSVGSPTSAGTTRPSNSSPTASSSPIPTESPTRSAPTARATGCNVCAIPSRSSGDARRLR